MSEFLAFIPVHPWLTVLLCWTAIHCAYGLGRMFSRVSK